ncbi:MAG: hypothetical protein RLZZ168_171 [Cyanobacteriota bacterium]|jgi:hypothetical protein
MLRGHPLPLSVVAQTRTITALDPATGTRITRRTARTYVAVVVTGDPALGQAWPQSWAGRPDLAAKQLAKWGPGSTARLAPVVEDPWAEAPAAPEPVAEPAPAPAPAPVADPVAAQELTRTRPTLPGEALPPEPPAWPAPEPTLPELRRDAAAGRPVSLAALARTLGRELGLPQGGRRPAAGDTLAGQPWDPGTPEARARVALQGERVATLWPIAQAVRGAGLTLPGAWASDGPVMAGAWPVAQALDYLPSDCLQAAAVALAALPPVTVAQERALAACRAARARAVV